MEYSLFFPSPPPRAAQKKAWLSLCAAGWAASALRGSKANLSLRAAGQAASASRSGKA